MHRNSYNHDWCNTVDILASRSDTFTAAAYRPVIDTAVKADT